MSVDRERLLLSAALSYDDAAAARELWMRWSAIRPGIELISPAEAQCLTSAWRAAGSPQDPDEGRVRGMWRQASVATTTALETATQWQQRLAARGVPSALTGGLAIALLALPCARAPLGVPQLLIEPSATTEVLGRPPTLRERSSGFASLGEVHVVWRSPLCQSWSLEDAQAISWHGRELIAAAPHRAAFDSMALAALTSRAPDARIVASILDVATASTLDAFDRAAWTSLLSRNRLGRLIGAAARPYAPAMPARLSDLLGSSHPTTHWTRIQARSLRPVIVRTLPD